jgi:hypothetical protein
MALTNVEKQRRFRERRKELAERAVTENDSDTVIMSKLVGALGLERLQEFARAMPQLLAEQRSKPKAEKKARGYSLADNERFAPGGKLEWYKPNARWNRERAQALVPLPPDQAPGEYEKLTKDKAGNVRVVAYTGTGTADALEYEIHTKRPDGKFPVTFKSLTGYCSDSGLLNASGRPMTRDEECPNAATIKEAKARAQAHFERRLAGLEVAPPPPA